jgi:hypothetical protein
MRQRLAVPVALAAALACQKTPGPPSAEYAQARTRHLALVARFADDADARPEMDEVLALLERVPAESVDAPAAQELASRIADGRRRLAAEQAERERRIAAAGPAQWAPSGGVPAAGGAPPGEQRPAIALGMKLEDFRAAHGECFEPGSPIQIEIPEGDGGLAARPGEAFGLKGDPACREKYPGQVGRVAIFSQGALVALRPAGELKEKVRRIPGKVEGFVQLPDGGTQAVEGAQLLPDGGVSFPGGVPLPDGGRFFPDGGVEVIRRPAPLPGDGGVPAGGTR